MGNRQGVTAGAVAYLILITWAMPAALSESWARTLGAVGASNPNPASTLTVDQVVRKLQEKNAERAASLAHYEATRVYRMRYRGFPSNHDAEMVVNVNYRAPNSKKFSVVSQSGSKFIIDHIFNRLLDSEQEASDDENRRHTALSTENYDFSLAGYEPLPEGGQYVLNLYPKTKNKFLYRGQIWVDAKDFAVVRIKGEPAKNPSLWIKKTSIEHRYTKVNGFWLPAENHTESVIRMGGVAELSIEYKDYRVTRAGVQQGASAELKH